MRIIGITGGIGSGKTQVCRYLEETYGAAIILADDVGHAVMEPGTECAARLRELFPETYFLPDGRLDRRKAGKAAFENPELLERMNAIIHPAVWDEIMKLLEKARREGVKLAVIEAALLIGTAYRDVCDEFWYVYAREDVRIRRLKEGRGIEEAQARRVMKSQLSEEEFRNGCDFLLDNSGSFAETAEKIKQRCRGKNGL